MANEQVGHLVVSVCVLTTHRSTFHMNINKTAGLQMILLVVYFVTKLWAYYY